jgi:hypothetical protein
MYPRQLTLWSSIALSLCCNKLFVRTRIFAVGALLLRRLADGSDDVIAGRQQVTTISVNRTLTRVASIDAVGDICGMMKDYAGECAVYRAKLEEEFR